MSTTSLSFTADDTARLRHIRTATSIPTTAVLRVLIRAYTDGLKVPGLPVCPPFKAKGRKT